MVRREIALLVLLAVAVNVVAVQFSERFPLSLDLTKDSRYALSDETSRRPPLNMTACDIYVLAAEEIHTRLP